MKVVFITNYINHHQALVADEFYRLLGENYCFVATIEMYEWRKKLGYPDSPGLDESSKRCLEKNTLKMNIVKSLCQQQKE